MHRKKLWWYKRQYTPLKYLQSSGTQYIDTGVYGDLNTKVEIAYNFHTESTSSGSGRVFGSREDSVTNALGIGSYSGAVESGTKITLYFSNSNTGAATSTTITIGKWNVSFISSGICSTNGTKETIPQTPTTFTTPQTLKLFGFDSGGTMGYGICQIASCRIWQGTKLLLDMIPVLDKDGVPCMYDRAYDNLYYNQGSGTFTYEEWDINELDYVKTYGDAYANTYYYGNLNTATLITAQNSNLSTTGVGILLGSRTAADTNNISTLNPSNGAVVINDFGNYNKTRQSYSDATTFNLTTKFTSYNSKNYRYVINESTGVKAEVTTAQTSSFTTPTPLYIAYKSSGYSVTSMKNYIGNIYACKIWDNDVLVRDFIPVSDENNICGLYDKCLNIIFYSDGSNQFEGHFIADKDYTVKQYLQSSGGQYIDTGYKPNGESSAYVDWQFTTTQAYQARIYGANRAATSSGASGSLMSMDCYVNGAGSHAYSFGINSKTGAGNWKTFANPAIPQDTNRHKFYIDKNIVKFDAREEATTLGSTAQSTYSVYLYYCNLNGTGTINYIIGKIWKFRLWESGEYQRNYIPVISEDNEIGMYDLVNKSLYSNNGTGEFSSDNITINNVEYKTLAYLGTDGNQYIDLGFTGDETTIIKTKFKSEDDSASRFFVGARQSLLNKEIDIFAAKNASDTSSVVRFGNVGYDFANTYNKWITCYNSGAERWIDDGTTKEIDSRASTATDFTTPTNMRLFNIPDSGYDATSHKPFIGKCAYFKCWKGGNLIRDMIPVKRISDSVVGMLDLVTLTFYTNAGTGSFTEPV